MTEGVRIVTMRVGDTNQREQARSMLAEAFSDPERYDLTRLDHELCPRPGPFYRVFFLAEQGEKIVGVGGIKAADWASDTHLLYLSAVEVSARGQGVGRSLLAARIAWARTEFAHGRLLVSTAKIRRFKEFGFKPVGKYTQEGRQLMLLEF